MTWFDAGAAAFFLISWWFVGWLIDRSPWRGYTLARAMTVHRREWMRRMALRQVRLVDANIVTGLQQATSFFASTALIAVGAGFGLLTAADTIISAFEDSVIHVAVDRSAFYVKTACLMTFYAYAFFKFGWAYRLFNYSAVMLAAVPEPHEPGAEEAAASVAEMNIAAAAQYTAGIRAFFLAIGFLAWLATWYAFVTATFIIVAALTNRQFNSRAREVARESAARLEGVAAGS